MKKHDETKDVALLRRRGIKVEITPSITGKGTRKVLVVPTTDVGIRTWGRIDFLVNHCDYGMVRRNGFFATLKEEKKSSREAKKEKKAPKLQDKSKKQHKKK